MQTPQTPEGDLPIYDPYSVLQIDELYQTKRKLHYVLGLKIEEFFEQRLQTKVIKLGLAKSIYHARVLIKQRHIRAKKQVVNVPSFIGKLDSQKHIDFGLKSPFRSGLGCVKRKNAKKSEAGDDEDGDLDDPFLYMYSLVSHLSQYIMHMYIFISHLS